MTTYRDFKSMRRGVEDARKAGFIIESDWYNADRVMVLLDNAIWTKAAENVIVHRSDSVEDAMTFVDGAMWAQQFMRLTEPSPCQTGETR